MKTPGDINAQKTFDHLLEIVDAHLKLLDEEGRHCLLQAVERAVLRALLGRSDV